LGIRPDFTITLLDRGVPLVSRTLAAAY